MHMHAHMHMHMHMHMRIVYVCTYTALSFMLSVHVTLHTELELIRITPCVPWSHALLKPHLPVSPWDSNTPWVYTSLRYRGGSLRAVGAAAPVASSLLLPGRFAHITPLVILNTVVGCVVLSGFTRP